MNLSSIKHSKCSQLFIWLNLILLIQLNLTACTSSFSHLRRQSNRSQSLGDLTFQVDHQASELIFNNSPFIALQQKGVHRKLSQSIESMLNQGRYTDETSLPVRYRIHVKSRSVNYLWTLIPCAFYLTLVGCPLGTESYRIMMSIEIQGRIYTEQIQHKSFFGYYYNLVDQLPFQKALLKGFRKIMKRIKRNPPPLDSSFSRKD